MPFPETIHMGKRFVECPQCGKPSKIVRETGVCLQCELEGLELPRRFVYPPREDMADPDLGSHLDAGQTDRMNKIHKYNLENV